MPDPKTDPEAEKDLLPLLKRDEHLLWAARREKPSPTIRFATYFWSAIYLVGITFFTVHGSISGVILVSVMILPTLYLYCFGNWFVTYGVTQTRLYILCRLRPRSWETLNLVDWNPHWLRFDAGKNRIRFAYHGRIMRHGWWNKSQYRRYYGPIESVPDIEAVRELLLKKIGASERPAEETPPPSGKQRKPAVPGTMTG